VEELCNNSRIIRPAYKPIAAEQTYVPLEDR
jgi:hypothetical protein